MDMKIEIKEELLWLEGIASSSLDSDINNTVSNDTIVKVEPQTSTIPKIENDALQPRTPDDVTVLSTDIKDEISKEEHGVDQMAPCGKEGNNVEDVGMLHKPLMLSADGCNTTLNTKRRSRQRKTNSGQRPFSCKISHETFVQAQSKPRKVRKSEEFSKICSICNKKFDKQGYWRRHQLTHSAGSPFSCSICDRTFSRKDSLRTHLRYHTAERRFRCTECNRAYIQQAHLKVHLLTHSGKCPYHCTICGIVFAREEGLVRHMLTHTGERRFCCSICGNAFSLKHNLIIHLRIHSGERPYHCVECRRTFVNNSNFKRHLLTHSHSRDKPYHCAICDKTFFRKHDVKVHLLKHS